eukprot:746476-Hanusia_phi.AAC.2
MYVMGKCPWCGKALQDVEDKLKCEFSCEEDGRRVEGRLDFRLHMVGLNDGSYEKPELQVEGPDAAAAAAADVMQAIHGTSELAGEKLELCARQHYARDYQYVKFISCMDRNGAPPLLPPLLCPVLHSSTPSLQPLLSLLPSPCLLPRLL